MSSPEAVAQSWSYVLPFFSGLISGFIAQPLLEFLKDAIGASRAWRKREAEIVSTVRFVLGQFAGFQSLCKGAYGKQSRFYPEKARPYIRLVKAFDLATIAEKIGVLSELHPKEGKVSGASQYLVSQVSATLASFLAVQQIEPTETRVESKSPAHMRPSIISVEDIEVWQLANIQLQKLHIFLASVYAPKMQLDRFSLVADSEVMHFEREVSKHLSTEKAGES